MYYVSIESFHIVCSPLNYSTLCVPYFQLKISDEIRRIVSKCERSLFIFEDIQKMPSSVLDAVVPFIDYHSDIDGVDFRFVKRNRLNLVLS